MKRILFSLLSICALQINAQPFCFNTTATLNPPPAQGNAVCNADFNNDGNLDMAVSDANNSVVIFAGQGNGSFFVNGIITVQNNPWGLISGDFNNDGNKDLAVPNYNSGSISILIGNGNFGFAVSTIPCAGQPKSIRTADMNNDGNLDLAVCHFGPSQVSVWLGNGSGSFSTSAVSGTGTNPYDLVIADFNNDGKKDIVTANSGSNNISYFGGTGTGSLNPPATIGGPLQAPWAVCTKDFNGDGNADFAIANGNGNYATIFTGNGAGGFSQFNTSSFGGQIRGIASADFNGDNIPDLACSNYGPNTITFLAGPSFNTTITTYTTSGQNGARWIDVGDFNNDGKQDACLTNINSGGVIPYINNMPYAITAVTSPTVICSGNSAVLTTSGNIQAGGNTTLTYSWSPATDLSSSTGTTVTATPGVTTTFTAVASYSGCTTTASAVITLSVNPTPTITVNSPTICVASSGTLIASGASTYSWTPSVGLSSTTGASVVANPTATTVYSVTGTSAAGCPSTTTTTVTVNPLPLMTSANNKTICSGTAVNLGLTSNISSSHNWITLNNPNTSGESITTQTTSTISNTITHTLSIPATLVYTVTPTAVATGCVGPIQTVTITVNPVDAILNFPKSLCSGTTFTAVPVDGINGVVASPSTYTWLAPTVTGGVTGGASGSGSNITGTLVNPTTVAQTATYTITPTALGTCVGATFKLNVTINPSPVMTSVSTKTVCSGNSVNLALTSGASATYSWIATDNVNTTGESTTPQVGSTINNTVTSTSSSIQTVIYTVTPVGTAGSCVGTAQTVSVTLDNLPPVAAAGTDVSICTYSLNMAGNAASPGTGTWSLQSQSVPTFTTNGLPSTNNNALVWFTGINTGNFATLRWTINSQLGVCPVTFDDIIVTKANCPLAAAFVTSPTSHTLCIKPASTVTVSYTDNSSPGSNGPIASYSWTFNGGSPATATGPGPHIVTYSYTSTQQSYNSSLTVVDQISASSNSTQLITLNPYPSAAGTITGSVTVCQGQNGVSYSIPTILNAGSGYSWVFPSGASSTNPNNIALTNFSTIAQSGVIKVCGLNTCGAGDTSYLSVTVNPLPAAAGPVSGTTTVCQGQSAVSYSIAALANASSYLWILPAGGTTASTSNTASVNFSNAATSGIIKVVGKNGCGAGDTSYLALNVNTLPNVTAGASAATVCFGTAVTLNGGGASTYTWTGGVTDGASFVPLTTSSYVVSGTGANACVNTATVSVTVNQLPNVIAIASPTVVCIGSSLILNGGGATMYVWSGGIANGNSFVPSATSDYTVTGTDVNACVNTATITVVVNPLPVVTASVSASSTCANNSIILTGNGAVTYTWTGGVTDGVAFTPTVSATYTVTGADANQCSGSDMISVNVITPQVPSICMLSVDSMSLNNVMYWDKTLYQRVDSFIIYREVSTGIYKRVGAVSKDSLSMFVDSDRSIGPATGDPNVGYYHYKLQIRDSCGNYSALSLYHTSVFFVDGHTGTFTWNSYDVEGQPTPVGNYYLMRDSANINDWRIIGIVAGSTGTLNDPTYALYQSVGNWRVDADGFGCTPTYKYGNSSVNGAVVKAKSNISNNRATKINQNSIGKLTVYPNPSSGIFVIETNERSSLQIFSLTGELVLSQVLENTKNNIDAGVLRAGIYTICISSKTGITNTKLVIVK
jgi:hypothetical protein